MTPEELDARYGSEYPEAVMLEGVRMPLKHEGRFSRSFYSAEKKQTFQVSRFMDGSASIAADELLREWHNWNQRDRMDFCQSCSFLRRQSDFPEMLRLVLEHGGPTEWSAIALQVTGTLPQADAFDLLVRALRSVEIGRSCNFAQAIARTKHPDAERTLREHFNLIWAHNELWNDAEFVNWIAYDATTCLGHIIEVGAPKEEYEEFARKLVQHRCIHNRESCALFLGKHYPELFASGGR